MKYRKKPVEVEAFQYTGELINAPEWAKEAFEKNIMFYGVSYLKGTHQLFIKTLEGNHHVSINDYIIKGIKGELYPCKADIFNATYEPVEEENIICGSTGVKCSNCQPCCNSRRKANE